MTSFCGTVVCNVGKENPWSLCKTLLSRIPHDQTLVFLKYLICGQSSRLELNLWNMRNQSHYLKRSLSCTLLSPPWPPKHLIDTNLPPKWLNWSNNTSPSTGRLMVSASQSNRWHLLWTYCMPGPFIWKWSVGNHMGICSLPIWFKSSVWYQPARDLEQYLTSLSLGASKVNAAVRMEWDNGRKCSSAPRM